MCVSVTPAVGDGDWRILVIQVQHETLSQKTKVEKVKIPSVDLHPPHMTHRNVHTRTTHISKNNKKIEEEKTEARGSCDGKLQTAGMRGAPGPRDAAHSSVSRAVRRGGEPLCLLFLMVLFISTQHLLTFFF